MHTCAERDWSICCCFRSSFGSRCFLQLWTWFCVLFWLKPVTFAGIVRVGQKTRGQTWRDEGFDVGMSALDGVLWIWPAHDAWTSSRIRLRISQSLGLKLLLMRTYANIRVWDTIDRERRTQTLGTNTENSIININALVTDQILVMLISPVLTRLHWILHWITQRTSA